MRIHLKAGSLPRYLVFCGFFISLTALDALGGEGGDEWRAIYDPIMMYVNFTILVFLFWKFLKKPLMDFLNLRSEELAREIKKLEDEKRRAEIKSQETLALLEKGEAHIEQIKTRIIEQGMEEKEKIINDARSQSRFMLDDSKQRVGSQILQAKQAFRVELVEAAISLAMERLPKELTEKDSQAFVGDYLAELK